MEIMELILLIGAIHGIIMSALLAKSDRKANIYFILLLFFVSAFLLLQLVAPYDKYPRVSLLSYVFIYSYIPVYVIHIQDGLKGKIAGKNWLLFLPSAAFLIACVPYLFKPTSYFYTSQFASLIVTDIIAISVNILLLLKTSKSISQQEINGSYRPNHFFHGLMIVSCLMWLVGILQVGGLVSLPFTLDLNRVFVGMSIFVFGIGYFLVYEKKSVVRNKSTYDKLSVSKNEQQVISEALLSYLNQAKPYTNPECNLTEVASSIGVEKTKLSYVINRHMSTNFNRLMNELRIKEFLHLVEKNQLDIYDLTGVATRAGFKSKSTFFKSFKDVYGVSPREFLSKNSSALVSSIHSN